MKKKIAFLMASVMTMTMMPTINSYARTTNTLSGSTAQEKTLFYEPLSKGDNAPDLNDGQSKVKHLKAADYLSIELKDQVTSNDSFKIKITDGKFAFRDYASYVKSGDTVINRHWGDLEAGTYKRLKKADIRTGEHPYQYVLTSNSETEAKVEFSDDFSESTVIKVPLVVRSDEDLTSGKVKVEVTSEAGSPISSSTHVLASIEKGSTRVKVTNPQTGKNRIEIEKLTVEEVTAGSMDPDNGEGFYLQLPSGYSFSGTPVISGSEVSWTNAGKEWRFTDSHRKLEFTFEGFKHLSSYAASLEITGLTIIPTNSSDTVTKEDVKVDIDNIGGTMVKQDSVTVGTHADYNMNFKTEGTVPTLLNGYYEKDKYDDKTKSVKVVVSEDTAKSLINGGDLVLNISDSAKITAVKIEDTENIEQHINGTHYLNKVDNANVEVKESKVTLRGLGRSTESSSDKAKFTISFYLSLESGFVGDVTMKVSGDAIRNNTSVEPVVIAKSVNPLKTAKDDYTVYFTPGQTVELEDIVLTEQLNYKDESSLEKDKTLVLGFSNNNNYLSVVGTPTVKTENGLTVKDVKVTNTTASGSALSFRIDDPSSKGKASKITISGLKVAASASTPEGTYELLAAGTAVGGNSTSIIGSNSDVASFSTDGMTIAKLQYGGKVAMKITIGDKMVNVNGQNVEMKLAPFIDAKTGTTYMQVSDIVKATGKTCTFFDNRIQKVEGMDKTLFVTFGDRTFEKDKSIVKIAGQTIPETMTNEQGQAVNMIIKDDYTCLPLRYFVEKVLGQKINWNGTDNTITVE